MDGTTEMFYTLQNRMRTFVWSQGSATWMQASLFMEDYYIVHEQYSYPQPDFPTVIIRNLETVENSDGTQTTTETNGNTKQTKEMNMIGQFFFLISNLGGLYTFIFLVVGLFLRPMVDKIIAHHGLNAALEKYSNDISEIENQEGAKNAKMERMAAMDEGNAQLRHDKNAQNMDQSYQDQQPLIGQGADQVQNQYDGQQQYNEQQQRQYAQQPQQQYDQYQDQQYDQNEYDQNQQRQYQQQRRQHQVRQNQQQYYEQDQYDGGEQGRKHLNLPLKT